jgi:hypothetical protein
VWFQQHLHLSSATFCIHSIHLYPDTLNLTNCRPASVANDDTPTQHSRRIRFTSSPA